MNRSDLFQKALAMSKEKYKYNPHYFVLQSIIAQLEYLVDVINGDETDLSKLKTIMIGRIAAYDIDNWDFQLAEILHFAAEEARKMNSEYGSNDEFSR